MKKGIGMKTIATKHYVSLTLKAFQNPYKRVATIIHTLKRKVLSLITLKISKECAKGNFQYTNMQRLKRASIITLSFKESLYVRAKLFI